MRALLLTLAAPALLCAHALTVAVEQTASAVVLRAGYDNAEPAGRADVAIFRPGNSESPYQTGSTDAAGAFAFVPSEPGVWQAVIDDGFGHRTETAVRWSESPVSEATPPTTGTWQSALTGVSLLLGLTGIWLWRTSLHSSSRGRP
jgi:nickel transport protein